MCGIAGRIGSHPAMGEDRALVERMCAAIRHRGPDDLGIQVDGEVVLGLRRLSIVDLGGGHQPLSNETGDVWVTFNGEIYNYRELRDELKQRGHHLRTSSDTEVLVHLYEDEGIGMLERLNGMFAFGLWDARRHTLYLVRDRLGIKPLYYALHDGGLSFASELKALLQVPGLPRTLDHEALAEYLTLNYINEPRTPFAGVRKLASASYLEWHAGTLTEHRYWRAPAAAVTTPRSLPSFEEELRALLVDAVRLQLRADVPVGLFASGGIDSTTIMWAASALGISLEAFVCEFDTLKRDTPYARIAAQATGMRLKEFCLDGLDAGRLLPQLVWHMDEPFADVAMLPCYLIAQAAAREVKVVLNGTGGDELFGGYPRYNLRALVRGSRANGLADAIVEATGAHPIASKLGAALDYRERYLRVVSIFPEREAASALGVPGASPVRRRVSALFAEAAASDEPGSMMFVDLHTYLPGELLMLLDKTTMAASLESRVPLLDHRLVELAARVPGRLRMQGGDLKWLLRRALRGRVPDAILDREKQGFGPPVLDWMRGRLGEAATRALRRPNASVRQLLDHRWLARYLGPGAPADTRRARQLWTLLALELWLQIFVAGVDPKDLDFLEPTEHRAVG